jgi:hypothetical protein
MHTERFINFIQSGMYIDYIIKKITEAFLRNFFVYSSIFFSEKYIIEFLSKKTVDNLVFFFNFQSVNKNYEYSLFYNNIVVLTITFLFFIEILLFFFF